MDVPTTTDAPTTAIAVTKPDKVAVQLDDLQTIEQFFRVANAVADTEFVPKAYRKKPADVLAAFMMGRELNLQPMQSLSALCVVNGVASLWGDGLLAVIIASPAYVKHDEFFLVDGKRRDTLMPDDLKKDSTGACCVFWRRGRTEPTTRIYTIAHAKKASLWTKAGPWASNPDRMLQMRARSFAARDCFPDVVRGIKTIEEVQDLPPGDAPPVVREVRRMSDTPIDPDPATADDTPPVVGDAPDVVDLDPLGVKDVQSFLGGWTATLTNGVQVDIDDEHDAVDLEKFKDTPTKLRLTVKRVADTLQLVSFSVVE